MGREKWLKGHSGGGVVVGEIEEGCLARSQIQLFKGAAVSRRRRRVNDNDFINPFPPSSSLTFGALKQQFGAA